MDKADRVEAFSEFLRNEGFASSIDSDGDIIFKYEGRTYCILLDEADDEYFRIVFPNFWRIESEIERVRVERAALKATAETKVAKVYPVRDNTWASVELFCASIDHPMAIFYRCMSALQTAIRVFADEMGT